MKYTIEKVIDGIIRYMDKEIYSGMNDLQELVARVVVGRVIGNEEHIKKMIINNGYLKTFGIIESDGMIDVKSLACDIKRELERKESISISLPMFGKWTFHPNDVDILYHSITGEELHNETY